MFKRLAILSFAFLLSGLLAQAEMIQFTVINQTELTLTDFSASPTGEEPDWQGVPLSEGILEDGMSSQVSLTGRENECDWSLRATTKDGDGNVLTLTWTGLDLCEITQVTLNWNGETATADVE